MFGWFASVAAAAPQVWTGLEARVPLVAGHPWLPTHLRWIAESRYDVDDPRWTFALLRGGLGWTPTRWFLLHVNAGQVLERGDDGAFVPHARVELEPNLRTQVGGLTLNARTRADLRWFPGDDTRSRIREQLRANWILPGQRFGPYASEELFVEIWRSDGRPVPTLTENRTALGLTFTITDSWRVDAAGMARWRPGEGVSPVLLLTTVLTPDIEPVYDAGGG